MEKILFPRQHNTKREYDCCI